MKFTSLLSVLLCFISLSSLAQKKELSEARAHFNKKEYTKAETAINAAIEKKKGKTNKEVWALRGDIYSVLATSEIGPKNTRIAFESYVQAESLGAENEFMGQLTTLSRSCFGVAYDYQRAKKYDLAIEMYHLLDTILVKIDPSDGQAKIVIAQHYFMQEKYDKSLEMYQVCIKNGQNLKDAYEGIDRTYQMSYDYTTKMRIANIEEALKKLPGDEQLLSIASEVYSSAWDFVKAEQVGNKLIENFPTSPNAHFSMGNVMFNAYSNAREARNIEQAEIYFEKALESYERANELAPNNRAIEYSLGNSYFRRSSQFEREKNDLGFTDEDLKKHEVLTKKSHDNLKKALPYLRSVYDSDETRDASLFSTLKNIYLTLDLLEEYKDLIDP